MKFTCLKRSFNALVGWFFWWLIHWLLIYLLVGSKQLTGTNPMKPPNAITGTTVAHIYYQLIYYPFICLFLLYYFLFTICTRAVRYDNIYRMDEIKVYRFILCSIIYIMVSQNTLFTVIPFHHFHWVTAIFIRRPPRGVKRRQSDQPGQNQGLQKRGTTSVARSHVFKHCSFKTTDFKLLKLQQQSYMRAPSLSVWKEHAFLFRRHWTIT